MYLNARLIRIHTGGLLARMPASPGMFMHLVDELVDVLCSCTPRACTRRRPVSRPLHPADPPQPGLQPSKSYIPRQDLHRVCGVLRPRPDCAHHPPGVASNRIRYIPCASSHAGPAAPLQRPSWDAPSSQGVFFAAPCRSCEVTRRLYRPDAYARPRE